MSVREDMNALRERGIVFDGAKYFINAKNKDKLAADAAMLTSPNAGVPALYTSFVDERAINILLQPRNSTLIFPEVKKGDWTNDYAVFRTVEPVGNVTPYTDFGNGASADVNVEFPTRQQYVGQTTIKYGDLEQERTAKAMIDLVSQKQISAATVIDIATNKINLLGVEGMAIYGLLNDPNIPSALTPTSVSGSTAWEDKDGEAIFDDIRKMFKEMFERSQGLVDANSNFVLAIAPGTSVLLSKSASQYNQTVMEKLKAFAPNTEIVSLPELASSTSGDTVMLIAKDVQGNPTGEFGYGDKMRAFRLVPESSYYHQKFAFSSYGAIIYYPFAVVKMTGVTGGGVTDPDEKAPM